MKRTNRKSIKPARSGSKERGRRHAEPPLRQYLPFVGFAELLNVDPTVTSADIGRLWCVLEKDDFSDEPLVRLEEVKTSHHLTLYI